MYFFIVMAFLVSLEGGEGLLMCYFGCKIYLVNKIKQS